MEITHLRKISIMKRLIRDLPYIYLIRELRPDLCDGPHLNLQHQGKLSVEFKFSSELSSTISVLIYAKFENVIEIYKSRHVLL